MTVMAYSTNPDPAWDTVWFTCEQVKEWNWMYWCSEEYDALHDEGMITMDQSSRADIYIQMQKLMDDDAHSVWISYPTNFYAVKNTIVPSMLPTGDFKSYRFYSK
jgi:peptide/nickel transport system substrate-binding protein